MEKNISNERMETIQLKSDLELNVNIQNAKEQEIDIFFGLQSQSENNRSITITLNNFKDKNGEDIEAKIIGVKLENDEHDDSYKFTINNKTEIIKMQFSSKILIENYDFNEINFDIVIGSEIGRAHV